MLESAAVGPALSGDRTQLCWESPDGRIEFVLSEELARELRDQMAALEADPPVRGAELGGVLFGRIETGSRISVRAERFEAIPLVDTRSASWRPGPVEIALLSARAADAIGLFRSHTRRDLYLDQDDQRLREQIFGDRVSAFLVLKPLHTKPIEGGVQVWDEAGRPADASLGNLRIEPLPLVERALPVEVDEPEDTSDRVRWGGLAVLLLAICGLIYWQSAALAALARRTQAAFQPPVAYSAGSSLEDRSFSMDLRGSIEGDHVTARWDPQSAILRQTLQARLILTSGDESREFVLGSAQLALGSFDSPPFPLHQDISPPPVTVKLAIDVSARTQLVETVDAR